jgi:hypothetical protein
MSHLRVVTPAPDFPLAFIPVPLATGDRVDSQDGTSSNTVTAITVIVTTASGDTITKPLTRDAAGWWMRD